MNDIEHLEDARERGLDYLQKIHIPARGAELLLPAGFLQCTVHREGDPTLRLLKRTKAGGIVLT